MDKPSIPKGTRDFGPDQMAKRQFIFNTIRSVFQHYGFQPLETPAMENLSTLTGKYGDEGDQLLFKILNSGDYLKDANTDALNARDSRVLTNDISEKGLRYDLTVPFARYVVMNRHEVTFPFKRYQIQPVWRADRPQKGRYREFYQCDADVVGTDSLICEAEIILMIRDIFAQLGITDYTIKLNHRGILSGLAELSNTENSGSLFVALDKLDKIGGEKVKDELRQQGFTGESIDRVFTLITYEGSNEQKIDFLKNQFQSSLVGTRGVNDLTTIFSLLNSYRTKQIPVSFDLSLARGLSYYTGAIFEVKINNVAIGSVCGGGRYDNLTGVFGMPDVSGTGISFGVDRIYDAMNELAIFPKAAKISSTILIAHMNEDTCRYGLSILQSLREKRISCEIYPDQAKLKKQLEYADKKMIPYTLVIGDDEMKSGQLTLKKMESGEQLKLTLEQLLNYSF